MLKVRLQRIGRTNDPAFRVVVIEHTASPKTGKFVEKLGTYNPRTKQHTLNAERAKYWLSVGAKASGTVHNMLLSLGVISGKKVNVLPRKSPPKKEEGAPEAKEKTAPEAVPQKEETATAEVAAEEKLEGEVK